MAQPMSMTFAQRKSIFTAKSNLNMQPQPQQPPHQPKPSDVSSRSRQPGQSSHRGSGCGPTDSIANSRRPTANDARFRGDSSASLFVSAQPTLPLLRTTSAPASSSSTPATATGTATATASSPRWSTSKSSVAGAGFVVSAPRAVAQPSAPSASPHPMAVAESDLLSLSLQPQASVQQQHDSDDAAFPTMPATPLAMHQRQQRGFDFHGSTPNPNRKGSEIRSPSAAGRPSAPLAGSASASAAQSPSSASSSSATATTSASLASPRVLNAPICSSPLSPIPPPTQQTSPHSTDSNQNQTTQSNLSGSTTGTANSRSSIATALEMDAHEKVADLDSPRQLHSQHTHTHTHNHAHAADADRASARPVAEANLESRSTDEDPDPDPDTDTDSDSDTNRLGRPARPPVFARLCKAAQQWPMHGVGALEDMWLNGLLRYPQWYLAFGLFIIALCCLGFIHRWTDDVLILPITFYEGFGTIPQPLPINYPSDVRSILTDIGNVRSAFPEEAYSTMNPLESGVECIMTSAMPSGVLNAATIGLMLALTEAAITLSVDVNGAAVSWSDVCAPLQEHRNDFLLTNSGLCSMASPLAAFPILAIQPELVYGYVANLNISDQQSALNTLFAMAFGRDSQLIALFGEAQLSPIFIPFKFPATFPLQPPSPSSLLLGFSHASAALLSFNFRGEASEVRAVHAFEGVLRDKLHSVFDSSGYDGALTCQWGDGGLADYVLNPSSTWAEVTLPLLLFSVSAVYLLSGIGVAPMFRPLQFGVISLALALSLCLCACAFMSVFAAFGLHAAISPAADSEVTVVGIFRQFLIFFAILIYAFFLPAFLAGIVLWRPYGPAIATAHTPQRSHIHNDKHKHSHKRVRSRTANSELPWRSRPVAQNGGDVDHRRHPADHSASPSVSGPVPPRRIKQSGANGGFPVDFQGDRKRISQWEFGQLSRIVRRACRSTAVMVLVFVFSYAGSSATTIVTVVRDNTLFFILIYPILYICLLHTLFPTFLIFFPAFTRAAERRYMHQDIKEQHDTLQNRPQDRRDNVAAVDNRRATFGDVKLALTLSLSLSERSNSSEKFSEPPQGTWSAEAAKTPRSPSARSLPSASASAAHTPPLTAAAISSSSSLASIQSQSRFQPQPQPQPALITIPGAKGSGGESAVEMSGLLSHGAVRSLGPSSSAGVSVGMGSGGVGGDHATQSSLQMQNQRRLSTVSEVQDSSRPLHILNEPADRIRTAAPSDNGSAIGSGTSSIIGSSSTGNTVQLSESFSPLAVEIGEVTLSEAGRPRRQRGASAFDVLIHDVNVETPVEHLLARYARALEWRWFQCAVIILSVLIIACGFIPYIYASVAMPPTALVNPFTDLQSEWASFISLLQSSFNFIAAASDSGQITIFPPNSQSQSQSQTQTPSPSDSTLNQSKAASLIGVDYSSLATQSALDALPVALQRCAAVSAVTTFWWIGFQAWMALTHADALVNSMGLDRNSFSPAVAANLSESFRYAPPNCFYHWLVDEWLTINRTASGPGAAYINDFVFQNASQMGIQINNTNVSSSSSSTVSCSSASPSSSASALFISVSRLTFSFRYAKLDVVTGSDVAFQNLSATIAAVNTLNAQPQFQSVFDLALSGGLGIFYVAFFSSPFVNTLFTKLIIALGLTCTAALSPPSSPRLWKWILLILTLMQSLFLIVVVDSVLQAQGFQAFPYVIVMLRSLLEAFSCSGGLQLSRIWLKLPQEWSVGLRLRHALLLVAPSLTLASLLLTLAALLLNAPYMGGPLIKQYLMPATQFIFALTWLMGLFVFPGAILLTDKLLRILANALPLPLARILSRPRAIPTHNPSRAHAHALKTSKRDYPQPHQFEYPSQLHMRSEHRHFSGVALPPLPLPLAATAATPTLTITARQADPGSGSRSRKLDEEAHFAIPSDSVPATKANTTNTAIGSQFQHHNQKPHEDEYPYQYRDQAAPNSNSSKSSHPSALETRRASHTVVDPLLVPAPLLPPIPANSIPLRPSQTRIHMQMYTQTQFQPNSESQVS